MPDDWQLVKVMSWTSNRIKLVADDQELMDEEKQKGEELENNPMAYESVQKKDEKT